MKLLLPLAVLLAALPTAAAPSITFSSTAAEIALPPGHTAAWVTWRGGSDWRTGALKDADSDGRITVSLDSIGFTWFVADIETGDWSRGARGLYTLEESPLPAGTVLRGTNNAPSILVVPRSHYGTGMWIRPGVGAWARPGALVAFPEGPFNFIEPRLMSWAPLPGSPALPNAFQRGDVLLLLEKSKGLAGTVDADIDAAPNPGVISMADTPSRFVEGVLDAVGTPKNGFFDVVRTGGTSGTVSVRCCAFSGTAVPGLDYTPPASQILTFGPGEYSKHVVFPLVNDDVWAGARTLRIRPEDPVGTSLEGLVEAEFFIDDDDRRPSGALGQLAATYPEGDTPWTLQVPVTVSGAFRGRFGLNLIVRRGNTTLATTPVYFETGETSKNVGVQIPADDIGTGDYDLDLTFDSSHQTVRIIEDDPPQMTARDIPGHQENSGNVLTVNFELKPDPKTEVSFVVSTVDGTAKAGSDYRAIVAKKISTTSISIGVSIDLIDDTIPEGPETFYLDISDVQGASLAKTRVEITIEDDDAIEVVMNETTVLEGNGGEQQVPVTLYRTGSTKWDQGVRAEVRSGTAGSNDFTQWIQNLIFHAGSNQATYLAVIRGDVEDERDETVEIIVTYGNRVVGKGTIVIRDDDGTPAPPQQKRRTSRH
jgi:hypothetical protein